MLIRILRWLIEKIGWKTLLKFFLLLVTIISAALGLGEIINGLASEMLFSLVFTAVLCSWLLARTRIRGWLAGLILLLSGILYLIQYLGHLLGPIWAFFRAVDYVVWQYLYRMPDVPIDLTTLNLAYSELYYGVAAVLNPVWEWIISGLEGLPLYDEIAISVIWGLVIWIIACWAGWFLRRHDNVLVSVLPAGVILTTALSYTWSGTVSLIPMLFSTLLLMTVINYTQSQDYWVSMKMDYPEDLPKEYGLTSTLIVLGIVAIASFLPTISISKLIETVQQFTKPQIEEAEPVFQSFGLEKSTLPREDIGQAVNGGFPRGHLMGSGPELAENVVMTVNLSAGIPKNSEQDINLPLYWRSLTYDNYTGFGWRSTDIVIRTYDDGEVVLSTDSPYHRTIQQDYRMAKGETLFLYASGEILSADDKFKVAYRPTPRYTEILNAHGDFFGASIDKASYRVQSLVPTVTEDDLRAAEGTYPGWVRERYLQLPESIPSRVYQLAAEITGEDATTYDITRSLENYLRDFEYTLEVEMPPLNRDMVDYFLFDLKKGYCDYYATSMVIMARSLGIPARIAIGYYRGIYDDVNRRFVVTEADAHSWVEVYFPNIGWVPFEPTAGRAAINRLPESFEIPEEIDEVKPFRSSSRWYADWNWTSIMLSIVAGIVLIILTITIIDNVRIMNFMPQIAIHHLYQRVYRLGRRLNVSPQRWTTPLEFSKMLQHRIGLLSENSIYESTLYPAMSELEDLTDIYELMLYSPARVTIRERNQVVSLWRRLRRRLWIARLRQIVYNKNNNKNNQPGVYT
jgi:transglutaminase-like putative cysteine protease